MCPSDLSLKETKEYWMLQREHERDKREEKTRRNQCKKCFTQHLTWRYINHAPLTFSTIRTALVFVARLNCITVNSNNDLKFYLLH